MKSKEDILEMLKVKNQVKIDADKLDRELIEKIISKKTILKEKNSKRNEKIMKLYERGLSDRLIAEEIGESVACIRNWRISKGLQSKNKTKKKFTDEQLIELHNKKLDDKKIAKIFKCSRRAVHGRRNKLGLEPNYKNYNKHSYNNVEESLMQEEKDNIGEEKLSDKKLIIAWCNQKNDQQIALEYKCDVSIICNKRQKLRLPSQKEIKMKRMCNFGLESKQINNRHIKKAEDIDVVEEYCKGLTIKQIAKNHNCTYTAIYNRLKYLCLIRLKKGILQDSKIIELFNEDKTDNEIAKITGYSKDTIKERRLKLGLRRKKRRYFIH